jgi:hypothetical protein
LNAGQVLKDGSNILGETSHYGISTEARSVTTCHSVFVDKATVSFQIREHESLQNGDLTSFSESGLIGAASGCSATNVPL